MISPFSMTRELKLRIVSALVMAVVVLAVTLAGGWLFRLLCAVIAVAIFAEWTKMATARTSASERTLSWVLMAVVALAILFGPGGWTGFALIAGLAAIAAIAAVPLDSSRWSAGGIVYAGFPTLALAELRGSEAAGLQAVLFLFVVVWATDILAYFVGRALGGAKLAPTISPGKTWSGAFGGTVAALLFGLAAAFAMDARLAVGALVALILALSVVSQIGDLFESWLKRRFQVKDSSHLIPGHGGVMDRVDGLAAAVLVLYVVGALAVGDSPTPALAFF